MDESFKLFLNDDYKEKGNNYTKYIDYYMLICTFDN